MPNSSTLARSGTLDDDEATSSKDNMATEMVENIPMPTGKSYAPSAAFIEHSINTSTSQSSHQDLNVRFIAIQEWEGYVTSVYFDKFTAVLNDLTSLDYTPAETMDFPLDDLMQDSLHLVKPGALFRWSIGYQIRNGSKSRISRVIFRRLPAWTKQDLQAAQLGTISLLDGLRT